MKIVLDATPLSVPHTGIGRYTRELAQALSAAHPECQFLAEACPPKPGLLTGRWWSIGLPRRLRQLQATLFHGTDFAVPLSGSCPSVVTVHDLSPLRAREWDMPATALRVARRLPGAIRRARAVIAPSERIKEEIVERFHTARDKIFVTPLAASAAFHPRKITGQDRYILYVGSSQKRKNLETLLSVFSRIRESHRVSLLVVSAIESKQGLAGVRVISRASDERLAELYSGCEAFVYPSMYEGFGLPVIEAMACGAPVITWRDTASADVAGEAGLTAGSADEVDIALRSILEHPERGAELRRKSLARASHFSWARTAELTWQAYESALSRS